MKAAIIVSMTESSTRRHDVNAGSNDDLPRVTPRHFSSFTLLSTAILNPLLAAPDEGSDQSNETDKVLKNDE